VGHHQIILIVGRSLRPFVYISNKAKNGSLSGRDVKSRNEPAVVRVKEGKGCTRAETNGAQ